MSSAEHEPSTDPESDDPSFGRTPDVDGDTLLRDVDTAHLRNAVQRRLFGRVIDPVRIARFPVLRRIGLGGMGVVYAAFDNELDRKVAIKLLRPGLGDDGSQLRDRLLREAKALARLSHPAIVQVYEAGEHDGQVYLAMEFVEGVTLKRWCDAEPRSVRDVLEKFLQAGEGLAAAHAAGLVHRDFKPDNVIVGNDGRVRVLDFGLALVGADTALAIEGELERITVVDRLTMTGAVLGTPAYMAAEQLRGEPADARSDQFSFAVALHEALFGVRPFAGETLEQLSTAVRAGEVTTATRAGAAPIARVLRRALLPDRDQRYRDIDELLSALRTTQRRRGIAIASVGAVVAVGISATIFVQRSREAEVASLSATVESLGSEVAGERTRADDAEAQLRRRADVLTIAEARFAARRDPSLALALLARLSDDDAAWDADTWAVAQRGAAGEVASEIALVPDGEVARHLALDGEAVVLQDRVTEAATLWYPWDGRRILLADGRHRLERVDDRWWLVQPSGSTNAVLWDFEAGAPITPIADVDLSKSTVSDDGKKLVSRTKTQWDVVDLRTLERGTLAVPVVGWLQHVGPAAEWVLGMKMDRYDAAGRLVSQLPEAKTGISLIESLGGGRFARIDGRDLTVWDSASGDRRSLELDAGLSPTMLAANAQGDALAIGDVDGEMVVIDTNDLSTRTIHPVSTHVEPRRWLADGRLLFARTPAGGVVIDAARGLVHGLVQSEKIADARLRGDGRLVGMSEGSVRAWTLDLDADGIPSGDGLAAIDGPAADGTYVALRSTGELVRWNGDAWDVVGRHEGALQLTLADAGGHVVTVGPTGLVLWSLESGEKRTLRDTLPHLGYAWVPAIDASGRWIAFHGESQMEVIDTSDGSTRRVGGDSMMLEWTFPTDEARFCVGGHRGSDSQLRCWDTTTWQELPEFPLPGLVMAFGPGAEIAVRRPDGVAIVDRKTGRASAPLSLGFVKGVRFSRDGRSLGCATRDGRLALVDIESGRVAHLGPRIAEREVSIVELEAQSARAAADERRFALSVDGRRVVALDGDGALQHSQPLPPAAPAELREWVRAHAPALPTDATLDRFVPADAPD
jgi:predicted Ser/Thr protein kinase